MHDSWYILIPIPGKIKNPIPIPAKKWLILESILIQESESCITAYSALPKNHKCTSYTSKIQNIVHRILHLDCSVY